MTDYDVPYVPYVAEGERLGAVTITLAGVQPEHVSWLWPGRLPLGKLVVLDGDPAVGKSTLAVDLAARVSTAALWPDGTACPAGDVLILSAEDGLADTIRPRLDAASGDPAKVHALTDVRYRDDDGTVRTRPPTLADAALIEQAIRRHGARLVIVDVLMAYLPGKVDSHRDQDIRSVLSALAAVAEATGCCILLLRHLNKAAGGNPLYRGGGSIGIVGAARAAFLAAVDPDDESRRVLAATKSNLAPIPEALSFRLVDSGNGCARVEWLGATDHMAGDLLGQREDDDRTERDQAGEWLVGYLAAHDGEAKAAETIKAAKVDGIAERTLQRARKRIGVDSVRRGFGEGAVWTIPATFTPSAPGSEGWQEWQERGGNGGPSLPEGTERVHLSRAGFFGPFGGFFGSRDRSVHPLRCRHPTVRRRRGPAVPGLPGRVVNREQRRAARRAGVPADAIEYAQRYSCPDCLADTELVIDGLPVLNVRHDASCPTYRRAGRRQP